jgi:hypothetical protein
MSKQSQLKESAIDRSRLLEVLDYDPNTGIFRWKVKVSNFVKVGGQAGMVRRDGYRAISFGERLYTAHRLAWFYVHGFWPVDQLDHVNRERDDNRIANLREATRGQNMQNRVMSPDNLSGFKCVQKSKSGRWTARIVIAGKRKRLGWFDTPEQAHAAYVDAAKHYFGEFARAA